MSIDDLKLSDLKMIGSLLSGNQKSDGAWKVGEKYFIRTVTMHLTGRLKAIYGSELLLEDAAWIADDGRFHNMLKTGEFSEVEPFVDDVILNRESLIDATVWRFDLPRIVKE